jgi:hypothetical protein
VKDHVGDRAYLWICGEQVVRNGRYVELGKHNVQHKVYGYGERLCSGTESIAMSGGVNVCLF